MIKLKLSEIAHKLNAHLVNATFVEQEIMTVSTDTRKISSDCLFVALRGENHDGHDFCQLAASNGAKALLVARQLNLDLPQLIVSDTRIALGQLGALVKSKLDIKTAAITGSCGKTTVKELTANILAQDSEIIATKGNFNNDIGVPLTLLNLEEQTKYAVIELGANHPLEIDYTSSLVKPMVALVNNIGASHLEGFGSIAGVAKAKGEIFAHMQQPKIAIYNLDSNSIKLWKEQYRQLTWQSFAATDPQADFYASNISFDVNAKACFDLNTPLGKTSIKLAIAGKHNIANAVAAAAISMSLGATLPSIASGLTKPILVTGRVNIISLQENIRLIDDTYNASANAMRAGADLLNQYPGKKIVVFGDMAELGAYTESTHNDIGTYIAKLNIDNIYTYGNYSKLISTANSGQHFSDIILLNQDLIGTISNYLNDKQQITILVKGARSMQMERVVAALEEKFQ